MSTQTQTGNTMTLKITRYGRLLYSIPNCFSDRNIVCFVGNDGKVRHCLNRSKIEAAGLSFDEFGKRDVGGRLSREEINRFWYAIGTNQDGTILELEQSS